MLYVPAYSDLALGSGVVFGAAGLVVLQLRDATFLPSTLALPVTHARRDNLRCHVSISRRHISPIGMSDPLGARTPIGSRGGR